MASNTPKAPKRVELKFCPVCGRDDRYVPFTGKSHFKAGARCSGQLVTVIYIPLKVVG